MANDLTKCLPREEFTGAGSWEDFALEMRGGLDLGGADAEKVNSEIDLAENSSERDLVRRWGTLTAAAEMKPGRLLFALLIRSTSGPARALVLTTSGESRDGARC